MRRIAIVADDFTGACDTGIQFTKRGLSTVVVMGKFKLDSLPSDVVVIDSETRSKNREEASRIVREISERIAGSFDIYYKKIDSTMRGHIGAEIDEMLDGLKFKAVLITPAYPENGRVVKDGSVFVNGDLLEKTEFTDPQMDSSYIPSLLKKETDKKIGILDLSLIEKGAQEIRRRLHEFRGDGVEIIVADAVSRKHLCSIAISGLSEKLLLCGSAGLAKEVAYESSKTKDPVLIISGSLKNQTFIQLREVESQFKIKSFKLNSNELFQGRLTEKQIDSLTSSLRGKGVAILTSALSKRDEKAKVKDTVSRNLGYIVYDILKKVKVNLILTGGDTAAHILSHLNIMSLKPIDEVSEGVPLCEVAEKPWKGLKIVTKAGGFGSDDTLVNAVTRLLSSF